MRTAKKTSKANTRTKPKGKAPKAVAKTRPGATAKGRLPAEPRKAAAKSKAKATSKSKAKTVSKTNGRSNGGAASKSTSAKSKSRSAPTRARKPPPRRDGSGRLNPKYARDLRALSLENRDDNNDRAFFKTLRSGDDLAEELGEEAVETMTSGEAQGDHLIGEEVEEERGGPFVRTRGDDEFAEGTDRSNPLDATREPFPRT